MEKNQLSMIIDFLREVNTKVLQAQGTLFLNDTLLKLLNNLLELLFNDFDTHAITEGNFDDVNQDMCFLKNVIQRTVKLSLTKSAVNNLSQDDVLNILIFKNLQALEVNKIPIQHVSGIQHLRTQIQQIICVQSLQQLQDLLVSCGADKSSAHSWEELVEGIFSYNALATIDFSFLYTPLLQTIDLSHNKLEKFTVKNCLPNLEFLNLSFNLMQEIPILETRSTCKLKVLILRNNYLKDLTGLSKLKNLIELDARCNTLTDHRALKSLASLPSLQRVNFEGNPLSFHSNHRKCTIQHLHLNAARLMLVLDGRALSRLERAEIQRIGDQHLIAAATMASQQDNAVDEEFDSPLVHVVPISSKRKKDPTKETNSGEIEKEIVQEVGKQVGSEMKETHLQMKQQVEQLRQNFGKDNWLAEGHLQQVLGIPKQPSLGRPWESILVQTQQLEGFDQSMASSAIPHKKDFGAKDRPHEEELMSTVDDRILSEDEDVNEGKLFTVQRENANSEMLLLEVGLDSLLEWDVNCGRVVQKWSLSSLQSCEPLFGNQSAVCLTFNVIQQDRRSRTYIMEPEEAKVLLNLLGDVLSSRNLSDLNQVVYRCMECSSVFSWEEDKRLVVKERMVSCPTCSSSIVCAMEDTPFPASRALTSETVLPQISQLKDSVVSCSVSSVGSTAILDESTLSLRINRNDSDIDIISNPSQSSIEVIDEDTRTPHRNKSPEENKFQLSESNFGVRKVFSPVGLTESSSSSSYTDSICTSYETQKNSTNVPLNTEQLLLLAHQTCANVEIVKNHEDNTNAKMEKEGTHHETQPLSSLQEMFEGLLEKIDQRLATTADLKPIANAVDSSVQYSYSDFQNVDHRLRLYFLQDLLKSDEEILMILRDDALKTGNKFPFPGLLVISTKHVWLMEVTGKEGENPKSWLKENMKRPLSSITGVFALPWSIGVGLKSKNPDCFILMLLQDSKHTKNFLQSAKNLMPESCDVRNESANHHEQLFKMISWYSPKFNLLSEQTLLVSLFSSFTIEGKKEFPIKNGIVIVQSAGILATESNLTWLFPILSDNSEIRIVAAQDVSNLMDVIINETQVTLHFIDETRNEEINWHLVFKTRHVVEELVVALRVPWENLFSVPLQVTEGNLWS